MIYLPNGSIYNAGDSAGLMPGDKKSKGFKQTLATRSDDPNFFGSLSEILVNPDEVLERTPDGYKSLEDILNNPFVFGAYDQRRNKAVMMKNELVQNDCSDEEFDVINETLNSLFDQDIKKKILKGRFISPKPVVIPYEQIEKYLLPSNIYELRPNRITFDGNNILKLITKDNQNGVEVHPYNYLVATEDATFDNPFGYSIISKIYWYIYLYKKALGYWAILVEDYGMPTLEALVEDKTLNDILNKNKSQTEKTIMEAIRDSLDNMRQKRIIVHRSGITVNTVESKATNSSNVYDKLLERCQKIISVLLTGHESGLMSTPGELGGKKVQVDIRQDICNSDNGYIVKYINKNIIKPIHELNFPNDELPIYGQPEDIDYDLMLKKVQIFVESSKLGYKITQEKLADTLHVNPEDLEQSKSDNTDKKNDPPPDPKKDNPDEKKTDPPPDEKKTDKKNTSEFLALGIQSANSDIPEDQLLIDKFEEYLLDPEPNNKMMQKVLKTVFDFVDDNKDLKKLQKKYYKIFSDIDINDFYELVTKFRNIAFIHGAISVSVENHDDDLKEKKNSANILNKSDDPRNLSIHEIKIAMQLEPEDAYKYFRSLDIVLPNEIIDELTNIRKHAFTIANVMRLDILQDFKDILDKAIKDGTTYQQFKNEIQDKLQAKGWLGKKVSNRPGQLGTIDSPWRLYTIYRTNLQTAYMDGRDKQMMLTIDTRPYVQIISTIDGSTTKACNGLHHKVFRIDDQYYQVNLRAPGHHGCRRRARSLSDKQIKDRGLTIDKGKNFEQYKNQKGFIKKASGWKPDLSKYPDELVSEYEKVSA